MNARNIQPLTAAGVAALLTAATITSVGVHSAEVSPSLRTEFAAVQLQALVVSAAPAAAVAPVAAVAPSVVAAAAAAVDPVQMVADVVKNVLSFAAAALWYAAFPITLPLSVIGGFVMSVAQAMDPVQASAATSPLQGVSLFFAVPNVLLTSGFANLGLSFNTVQQQHMYVPIGLPAASRANAAAKRTVTAPTAPAASVRSAKKAAAAVHSAPAAAKRSAARSR